MVPPPTKQDAHSVFELHETFLTKDNLLFLVVFATLKLIVPMVKELLSLLTEILRLVPRRGTAPPAPLHLPWTAWFGADYRAALRKAEELDAAGLYREALAHVCTAVALRPCKMGAHLKKGLLLLKLGELKEAKASLAMAKLYASARRERLEVLKLEYQLLAREYDRDPSKKLLRKLHAVLELACLESPQDPFVLGAYLVSSTYAIKSLDLGERERESLQRLVEYYAKMVVAIPQGGSGYAQRCRERALEEAKRNLAGTALWPQFQHLLS